MIFRFLLKLCLFAVPLIVILGIPVGAAVHMGEALPLMQVISAQMGSSPVLYGPADRDMIFAYKLLATQTRRPDVLYVGSSRVLQCRAGLLTQNPAAFYNAAGQGWSLRETRALVEGLTADAAPRIMIVGLDQPWFNADWVDWEAPHDLSADPIRLRRVTGASRQLIDAVVRGDLQLQTVFERREWVRGATGLGLQALQFGRGYRNDGSRQEGDLLVNPALADLARENDLGVAADGWRQFVQGNDVSEPMLAQMDAFLRLSQERGIDVIGFSPPFMPSIYKILTNGGKNEYIPKSAARLREIFARYDYAYFDFSDAAWVGGTDAEMYDGWHPSELLCLRITRALLDALPNLLSPYIDAAVLDVIAEQATNPLEVF